MCSIALKITNRPTGRTSIENIVNTLNLLLKIRELCLWKWLKNDYLRVQRFFSGDFQLGKVAHSQSYTRWPSACTWIRRTTFRTESQTQRPRYQFLWPQAIQIHRSIALWSLRLVILVIQVWEKMWLALLNQQSELEERLIIWARVPMGRYLKSLIAVVNVFDPTSSIVFLTWAVWTVVVVMVGLWLMQLNQYNRWYVYTKTMNSSSNILSLLFQWSVYTCYVNHWQRLEPSYILCHCNPLLQNEDSIDLCCKMAVNGWGCTLNDIDPIWAACLS